MTTLRDIPGESYIKEQDLTQVGPVKVAFTISDGKHPIKHPGIVIKVDGKPIGEPSFFGLDSREDVPQGVLKRLYGEVEADGLLKDVTADWSTVIQNSVAYQDLQLYVQNAVTEELEKTFKREFILVNARIQQQINLRLQALPEHRRRFAQDRLQKILLKFYGEDEEKVQAVVNVVLDALERDEYWEVLRAINSAAHGDVQHFADALTAFGLLELVFVGRQANHRIALLDSIDLLVANSATREQQMHQVVEANLWILGAEYALLSSNRTMKKAIESYSDQRYAGKNAAKRPDLLLLSEMRGHHLLIEFKRPSIEISRADETQAQVYRDDFGKTFHPMRILLIGGKVDEKLRLNSGNQIEYMSYTDLIGRARAELDWLVSSLSQPIS